MSFSALVNPKKIIIQDSFTLLSIYPIVKIIKDKNIYNSLDDNFTLLLTMLTKKLNKKYTKEKALEDFLGFTNMAEAIQNKNYNKAIDEMKDSNLYKSFTKSEQEQFEELVLKFKKSHRGV